MINRVKNTILVNNLIDPKEHQHIVLGLSGGPDSVCLFHILMELKEEFQIHIHPVHVNHMFRPGAAEEDQGYVEHLCHENGLECASFVYDCNALAKEQGISSEEAGRNARYEAFYLVANEVMEEYNVGSDKIKIAVAQNLNDQVETVLMRIMRGTGTEGLAGIEYERDGSGGTKIIRPILDIDRKTVEEYCEEHGLNPRMDHTNQESIYTRNKIRLELLPYMERNFNQNILETINRLCLIAKEDKDYMDSVVCRYLGMPLYAEEYLSLHPAIRKRTIMRRLEKIGLEQGISAVHLEAADRLIKENKTGTSLDLPHGFRISLSYGEVLFHGTEMIKPKETTSSGSWKNGIRVEGMGESGEEYVLRTRLPGDYIRLPGMSGRKKIQNLFVDLKLQRENRDNIPLLCIGSEVKWIIGDDASELVTGLAKGIISKDFQVDKDLSNRVIVEFNKKI